MAIRVAKDVRRTKVDAELDPMPADERKAIHNALSKMADISTHSEGEGMNRHLCILYTPGKRSRISGNAIFPLFLGGTYDENNCRVRKSRNKI